MENLIDYAKPLINVEQHLKQVHALCLERRFADAYEFTMRAIVELRGLEATLVLMNAEDRRRENGRV